MPKMTPDMMELYNDPAAVKVLATTSKTLQPNVAPVASIAVADDETLAFVDLHMTTSKTNLETTKRATISVFKPPTRGYQAKGVFVGWQTSGPIYDKITQRLQQLAKGLPLTPRAVGLIRITEAYGLSPASRGMKVY